MPQPDSLTTRQRQVVNKRLTLNLLIQGAAAHGHWKAHRLVSEQLQAINPMLESTYDDMMLLSELSYWTGGLPSIMGHPVKFWWRMQQDGHEFSFHPFLRSHGLRIAQETQRDVFQRCREAGVGVNSSNNERLGVKYFERSIAMERSHLEALEELAKDVCCQVYEIERDLLEGKLTLVPRFGTIRDPVTIEGQTILQFMMGWSAVVRREGGLKVKATATFWPLLVHELIKGTVELICLHGMNDVSESEYAIALERTDHIEYEIPMLQIGGPIFLRFLMARPREIALAESIMHVSKLEPLELEQFMFHLYDSPNRATALLRKAAATR